MVLFHKEDRRPIRGLGWEGGERKRVVPYKKGGPAKPRGEVRESL